MSMGTQKKQSGVHYYSSEEVQSVMEHVNFKLKKWNQDATTEWQIPLLDPTNPDSLFESVNDGVLLCALLNTVSHGIIPKDSIKHPAKSENLNVMQKTENLNLALRAAEKIGCKELVNIGANDLLEGKSHIVLGFLSRIVKVDLLLSVKKHYAKTFADDQNSGTDEQKLDSEGAHEILIAWMNFHLSKFHSQNPSISKEKLNIASLSNISAEILAQVMEVAYPDKFTGFYSRISKITPPESRAKEVTDTIHGSFRDQLGYAFAMSFGPEALQHGEEQRNVLFISHLFNAVYAAQKKQSQPKQIEQQPKSVTMTVPSESTTVPEFPDASHFGNTESDDIHVIEEEDQKAAEMLLAEQNSSKTLETTAAAPSNDTERPISKTPEERAALREQLRLSLNDSLRRHTELAGVIEKLQQRMQRLSNDDDAAIEDLKVNFKDDMTRRVKTELRKDSEKLNDKINKIQAASAAKDQAAAEMNEVEAMYMKRIRDLERQLKEKVDELNLLNSHDDPRQNIDASVRRSIKARKRLEAKVEELETMVDVSTRLNQGLNKRALQLESQLMTDRQKNNAGMDMLHKVAIADLEQQKERALERCIALRKDMVKYSMELQQMTNKLVFLESSFESETALARALYRNITSDAFEAPHKIGYLTKQGGNFKSWKRRYFVLQDNFLFYYVREKEEPKGVIHLTQHTVEEVPEDVVKRKFCFKIVSRREHFRDYYICADRQIEIDVWMAAIAGANSWYGNTKLLSRDK
eukprot:TRINITY_DN759_c0_g1_i3.p1 TRINITY_DN759_c0_g1~~TRINITY_DN759_c0_g1_i3.p1  ORF type:complete len:864 (+),score=193.10 TRINITY_DN759_c0_g1_i3:343-2592(+)